jgi:hypothetical protein
MGSTLSTSITAVFPSFRVSETQRLAIKGNAHGGEDASNDKCGTGEAYRQHRWNLRSVGVDVILDDHSEAERYVMEERDQEQHHENSYERHPEPGDKGIVVATGERDQRDHEPQRQRD